MSSEREVDPRNRRLRPAPEEMDAWAAREHKRRAAWLEGPSEEEKQDWARRYRWRAAVGFAESRLGPAQEDIDLWAERERQRRQEWLAGPSEAEKQDWAERQSRGFLDDLLTLPGMLESSDFQEAAQRFLREAELAGKGTVYALSRAPLRLWSYLVRVGKDFEQDSSQQPRRRRVRY